MRNLVDHCTNSAGVLPNFWSDSVRNLVKQCASSTGVLLKFWSESERNLVENCSNSMSSESVYPPHFEFYTACHHKSDISSSSSDWDHNVYAGPWPLDSRRNSVQKSGLKTGLACTRHQFVKTMQITCTGVGDHSLRAQGAGRNCAQNFDDGSDTYPGLG